MQIVLLDLLLALQAFHVVFLLLHDWIPLGALNNTAAVRAGNSTGKVLLATVISSSFYVFGFVASVLHRNRPYPHWLLWYLLISYLFLFTGELEAWWVPYFCRPQPERAARYRVMFAGTSSWLPERNGITVNTLHVILHSATVATLVTIGAVLVSR